MCIAATETYLCDDPVIIHVSVVASMMRKGACTGAERSV